jgi:hypothetical protein
MTRRLASSLYDKCHALFADYPLAVQPVNRTGTIRSIILMLQDGAHDGFFVLSRDFSQRRALFWVWAWPAGSVADIEADGTVDIPEAAANAITQGVPIPRDGSLFGWTPGGAITALVVVYTEFTPATPEPGWAVMPLAGISETQWPPFTDDPLFGNWTWDRSPAGSVIPLDELVAGNPDTVFWVDTKATLDSDCCAVAHDLTSPEGSTLRRGRYVYYQVLQADKLVPSLGALLTDRDKIDLATRFEQLARADPGSLTRNKG